MTDMIERVAAAIEKEALMQRTSFAAWGGAGGITPPLRMDDIARAAIEAMREPPEPKHQGPFVTMGAWHRTGDPHWVWDNDARAAYQTMIDAALGKS